MIDDLHFLALPKAEESPRSILLRTATRNGYKGIRTLALQFDPSPFRALATQLGKSDLIQSFASQAGLHADKFISGFYRQREGVTSSLPVLMSGTYMPLDALLVSKHRICPGCLNEDCFRVIQDIEWVDVCPYHAYQYIDTCPLCHRGFDWCNMQMSRCSCGHDFSEFPLPIIEGDASGAKTLLEALRNQDEEFTQRLDRILLALRFSSESKLDKRIELFNQAVLLARNPESEIPIWLQDAQMKHPGLPVRALIAPLAIISDSQVSQAALAALIASSSIFPGRCVNCECERKYFTSPELEYTFGISRQTLLALSREQLIARHEEGGRDADYSSASVCGFFDIFRHTTPNPDQSAVRALNPKRHFGGGLTDEIRKIRDGESLASFADPRIALSEYQIWAERHPRKGKSIEAPDEFYTAAEVAELLETYPDAIRRAIKAGKITTRTVTGPSRTLLIPRADVEQFAKEFIFIGALSKQYNAKPTTFSAQLMSASIMPVSGPSIDGALIPIYCLSDFKGHDLAKIAASTEFKTKAGRKRGDPARYDQSKWITAIMASKQLGVSVQKLSDLVAYGLLTEETPPNRGADNTRYFTVESVKSSKTWLDQSIALDDLVKRVSSSKLQFEIRFVRSGYIRPLLVNRQQRVSAEDAWRVLAHVEEYCTCTEAAGRMGVQKGHFHNMLKLGKIQAASQEESGIGTVILLRREDLL